MISVLVDHNIEGQALLLLGTLQAQSWATLLDLRFLRLADVGLSEASTDREVWRFAQAQRMVLLTENRRMSGLIRSNKRLERRTDRHRCRC